MAEAANATLPAPLRIVLTGFMGAGKTTVGILLAERLGWRFLDLDQHLETEHQTTVAGIFAQHGEPHFRTLESEALAHLLAARNIVLALGGGALESPANRDAVARAPGTCLVFLDAPLDLLLQRMEKQEAASALAATRPLLAPGPTRHADLQARHAARLPAYRTAALHLDTTHLTPHQVADRIVSELGLETLAPPRSQA